VQTASIIRVIKAGTLMMEAVRISETSIYCYEKALIIILTAVRT
jgi:hypothetical protein